jgi:hypothetical protein
MKGSGRYHAMRWNVVRATLDVHFVSPAPVHSPLGVGAQHAAPLRRLAVYL